MKWKFLSLLAVLLLVLGACNMNTTHRNDRTKDNTNVEPTRYSNNAGDGFTYNRNNHLDGNLDGNLTRTGNRDNFNTHHDRYEISKEAADKIVRDIPEIDHAYVLTTRNNAYVAATMDGTNRNDLNARNNVGTNNTRTNLNDNNIGRRTDEGHEVTDEVKNKIADIVKSVDRNIDNVYVSTNPDFVDLTNNYVEDMDNGKPIRGFFDQFGNMVERLFPQNGLR